MPEIEQKDSSPARRPETKLIRGARARAAEEEKLGQERAGEGEWKAAIHHYTIARDSYQGIGDQEAEKRCNRVLNYMTRSSDSNQRQ